MLLMIDGFGFGFGRALSFELVSNNACNFCLKRIRERERLKETFLRMTISDFVFIFGYMS